MTANARQLLHKTMLLTSISVLKSGLSGGLAGSGAMEGSMGANMKDGRLAIKIKA
jgi:hypothetical protein